MLLKDRFYIPECEPEPRTFTPDLNGLIAWLETQDGATEYDYIDSKHCLWSRFVGYTVLQWNLPDWFFNSQIGSKRPHTYAAALTRAKSLRSAREVTGGKA